MSEMIICFNEEAIKNELKELVRHSAEETLNSRRYPSPTWLPRNKTALLGFNGTFRPAVTAKLKWTDNNK